MDLVCAVLDAQGFYMNGQFYIRECAIVNDFIKLCQEFNPEIKYRDLKESEQNYVKYCTRYIHGLKYQKEDVLTPKSSVVNEFLNQYYKLLSSKEKPLFAIKNNQIKAILNECEIPFCDLTEVKYKVPSIKLLEKLYQPFEVCSNHLKETPLRENRCAYAKCVYIWKFIKEQNTTIASIKENNSNINKIITFDFVEKLSDQTEIHIIKENEIILFRIMNILDNRQISLNYDDFKSIMKYFFKEEDLNNKNEKMTETDKYTIYLRHDLWYNVNIYNIWIEFDTDIDFTNSQDDSIDMRDLEIDKLKTLYNKLKNIYKFTLLNLFN